jgi:ATP-dependent protease ClpP protease subunit
VVASKRFITKNSVMLIHQLKMGTEYSKYNEIEDYFNNAETLMEIVKNIYLENTRLEPNLLSELLSKDLWLNSSFCKSNGLVDLII